MGLPAVAATMPSANVAKPATQATRMRRIHRSWLMSSRIGLRRPTLELRAARADAARRSERGSDPGHVRADGARRNKCATIRPQVVRAPGGPSPSEPGPTLAAMTLGIVVFGAAFLVGLGLGTYTRRPLSTAFLVLGSFTALLMLSATGEVFAAAAVLVIVFLLGLVADTMRETVGDARPRLLSPRGRDRIRPRGAA